VRDEGLWLSKSFNSLELGVVNLTSFQLFSLLFIMVRELKIFYLLTDLLVLGFDCETINIEAAQFFVDDRLKLDDTWTAVDVISVNRVIGLIRLVQVLTAVFPLITAARQQSGGAIRNTLIMCRPLLFRCLATVRYFL
jgi:hypothetical protein